MTTSVSDDDVWLSICSRHVTWVAGCRPCGIGYLASRRALEEDSRLWRTDYVGWFRRWNEGKKPTREQVEEHGRLGGRLAPRVLRHG